FKSNDDNLNNTKETEITRKKSDDGYEQTYNASPMRWVMLLLFCMLSIANAIVWISFSPISDKVEEYYDISSLLVSSKYNCLTLIYPFFCEGEHAQFGVSHCLHSHCISCFLGSGSIWFKNGSNIYTNYSFQEKM